MQPFKKKRDSNEGAVEKIKVLTRIEKNPLSSEIETIFYTHTEKLTDESGSERKTEHYSKLLKELDGQYQEYLSTEWTEKQRQENLEIAKEFVDIRRLHHKSLAGDEIANNREVYFTVWFNFVSSGNSVFSISEALLFEKKHLHCSAEQYEEYEKNFFEEIGISRLS